VRFQPRTHILILVPVCSMTLFTLEEFHRRPSAGKDPCVMERSREKIVHEEETFRPEDGYASFPEKEEATQGHIGHRASDGFRHPFKPGLTQDLVLSSSDLSISSSSLH
jgi:hypothetical protein